MFKIKYFHMLVTFLFLLLANLGFSITYYVSLNGSDQNDGKSWEASFLTISKALSTAVSGDNVWVAEGTYKEGKTIEIKKEISVYGGFKGFENDISQRDFVNNKATINGEASYQCIKTSGVINGLYITNGGNCKYGGGVYNSDGAVTNCVIYSNSAEWSGGGVYNDGGTVINCAIYSNSASEGGGVFNRGTLTNCTVYSNSASMGGGVYNGGIAVTNCVIYSNSAKGNGGGVYNCGTLTNCTVYSNSASSGGGVTNIGYAVTNCIVWKNSISDISGLWGVTYSCFANTDIKKWKYQRQSIICEYRRGYVNLGFPFTERLSLC